MGFFLGLRFGHLLGKVAQGVELCGDRLYRRQGLIAITLLGDELAPDFRSTQPGIETRRAKLGVGLALAINDSADIPKQGGEMVFGALSSAGREGIETPEATFQLMRAFADGTDRKSTRLNSSHSLTSRMPSSA